MTLTPNSNSVNRSVARPVTNLGNTCFMNAILQALAHAPELLLAMDCESHRCHCPVAAENDVKEQQLKQQQQQQQSPRLMMKKLSPSASPEQQPSTFSSSSDNNNNINDIVVTKKKQATRKSKRNNNNSNNNNNGGSGGGKSPDTGNGNDSSSNASGDIQYCTLCEVERHIEAVHDMTKRDTPVAPSTFVDGFIDHVAPWFQLGVQEDSHEFLRLLIDAMQKSCLVRDKTFLPLSGQSPDQLVLLT
jgi:uncharacterized UBP type Zn finger protein